MAQTCFNIDYFSTSPVRMWGRHNSQMSVLLTLSVTAEATEMSGAIEFQERKRGFCHVFVFGLLCFHVRQGMNYEHFTQVPFDPTLMRSCNKSLRFSSVPAILCVNLFSVLTLLLVQAAFRDLWALGGRKMNSQQQALIRFDCSCHGVPMDNTLKKD